MQIISSHLGRRYKYPALSFKLSFASSIEKESNMCIFFRLCNTQLLQTGFTNHFSQCIFNILLIEQNMHTFKSSIIRSHTTIIQRHCLHTLLRNIPLGQSYSQFFRPVIPVIKENDHISRFYHTNRTAITPDMNNRFYKLISHSFIIRLLNAHFNVLGRSPNTIYNQIIRFLYTFPTVITVHRIVTTNNRSNPSCRLVHMFL